MTSSTTAPEALVVDLALLRRRGIDHHEIACELPVEWLREVLSVTDAEVEKPGTVDLRVHLQPRGVAVVTGTLRVAFDVPCGRCLAPAPVDERGRIIATYVRAGDAHPMPADRDDDEQGVGLSPDDLDVWTYEGTSLSLLAMTAETVKLAYPMRALCFRGQDCRGLCSNCGADLNAQDPEGRTCEACGRPVPRTPVAAETDDAEEAGAPGATAPNEPQGAGTPQKPWQAQLQALRKLRS